MGLQQCSVSAVSRVESPHHTSYVIADKLLSNHTCIHTCIHYSNHACIHSEICDNSMQATVLDDDGMKDDALNDRVAGSVASLDKRKGSIELNIGHFDRL